MTKVIHLDLELPGDLARLRLPAGVKSRLTALLDKQNAGHGLTDEERAEAEGLVEIADTLTYLGLKARPAS